MDDPLNYFQILHQQEQQEPESQITHPSHLPNNMLDPILRAPSTSVTTTATISSPSPCLLTPAQRILPHPSVLDPATRTPIIFSLEEATSALQEIFSESIRAYGLLGRRIIDVVIYDTKGGAPSCHKAQITPYLDLKALIKLLQAKVDKRQSEPAHRDRGRLLVKTVEIRSGTASMDVFFPPLKGEVYETKLLVASAEWVSWECGGPVDNYWNHYRAFMLSAASTVLPILKVRTVSCRPDDSMEGGHIFKGATIEYHRGRRDLSGKLLRRISFGQKTADSDAFRFGGDSVNEKSAEDEDVAVESEFEGKGKTKGWTYYQKLGGNPEMHKLHNFDHIYFVPKPEVEHRDYVEGETLGLDEQLMVAELTHEVKEELVTEKISEKEMARITRYRQEFEAARSFDLDDDEVYFPVASRKGKLPAIKLMLAKRKAVFVPAKYASVPLLIEPKPNKSNFASSYYQTRPTQPTTVSSTVYVEDQATQRYGSPRNTLSKSNPVTTTKARPFTPGSIAFRPMNTGFAPASSRSGSPALKYSSHTSSFHVPSVNNQLAGANTISRSRPASPLRFSQNTLYGMAALTNNPRHHNQLFIPSMQADGGVSTPGFNKQSFADWQGSGTGEAYVFDSKCGFSSNGSGL